MAYSYNEVVGTGAPQNIAVPEYIDQSHIKVSINGADTMSYAFTSASVIQITAPVGSTVRVRRSTSPEARVVDYVDGTSPTEITLDNDSRQAFYLAQEQLDATAEAVGSVGGLAAALASVAAGVATATAEADAASASAVAAAGASAAAVASGLAGVVPRTGPTGAAEIPFGNSAQRPGAPTSGHTRINSDTGALEYWTGSAWASPAGASGGLGNPAFYENDSTVSVGYTLQTGKNAMSAGPLTIADGITVTVPTGSTWSIV